MQNTEKVKKIIGIGLLATLASIGFHIYLSIQHYRLKFGLGEGKSLCNINETFNCDAVTASQYSTLLGSPLSNWGASTHLILSLFLFIGWLNLGSNNKQILRYSFWLSLLTSFMSIIMLLISIFKLSNYCLFCIVTYILSFILFLSLGSLCGKEALTHATDDIKDLFAGAKWVLIMGLLIPGISLLSNSIIYDSFGFRQLDIMTQESLSNWQNSPQMNFDYSTGLKFQKKPGPAKMQIVEFADFLCPHCKTASPSLHAFAESHPDVELIFKPFPLDGVCNEGIQRQGDGLRCQLAAAVYCSEKINTKGWAAHNYIFDRQTQWNISQIENDLKALSDQINVPLEELKKCISSSETHEAITKMAKEGVDAKIMGTPSIFVNGKALDRGQFLPILQGAYDLIRQ